MPRRRSKSREQLVASAMNVFWQRGYFATSMEDLVAATGVNRASMYTDFGGKEALFLACLSAYQEQFASPAIAILLAGSDGTTETHDNGEIAPRHEVPQTPPAGLAAIEAYFDHFIRLHVRHGMPGPGCFCANVMTEIASHHTQIRRVVEQHLAQLCDAFYRALLAEIREQDTDIPTPELQGLADFLATSSQGLWSRARSLSDVEELVRFKETVMSLLRCRLRGWMRLQPQNEQQ